jgi:hypothetical protein
MNIRTVATEPQKEYNTQLNCWVLPPVACVSTNAFLNTTVRNNVFCARFYCALLTTCFGPDRWPSSGKMYTKYILG